MSIRIPQTAFRIQGTDINALVFKPNETLTADRTLSIIVNNADRSLTISGNATISGTNTGDQTISDATVTFTDITTNNSSTSNHGFLKKLDNNAAHFMDGQGNWSTPTAAAAWGSITGTLSSQSDLNTALGGKAASGANTDITSVRLDQTGLVVKSIDASNALVLKPNESLTADRTLNIIVSNADRTLTISASTTLSGGTHSGTNTGDQTITLSGDISGTGTGAITTTIGAAVVTNAMLAGSIAASKLIGTDIATIGTITAGSLTSAVKFKDGTDTTKTLTFNLSGMTTAKDLTLSSVQTTTQILTIPNITGGDTIVTTGLAQSITGQKTLTAPVLGVATGTSVAVTGLVTSSGTAGIGYATGAGGTVSQTGNKGTSVTINKICGQITTQNTNLAAAAEQSFVVTNSTVAATDVVVLSIASGGTAGSYLLTVSAVASGSFTISMSNVSTSTLGEALVINFAVIKAVTS